jgi:Tfp pilus assembly protein PilN
MIKINLLSPLDKEKLKWEKVNSLVTQSIFWLLLTEAVFAGVFLTTVEYLKLEKNAVSIQLRDMQSRQDTQEVGRIEAEVKQYKVKIDGVNKLQDEHVGWSYLLETLSQSVPEGVRLDSIMTSDGAATGKPAESKDAKPAENADKYKVVLTGKAQRRENLLALEESLKKCALFSGLVTDDANYVQSTDINFSYVFYTDKDKLLQ